MKLAQCMIREYPHYRREVFVSGLESCGYKITQRVSNPRPSDVLVIWNRYGQFHQEALRFEAAGAAVLVAENGYFGSDERDNQLFAIGLGGHAGFGRTPIPSRHGRFAQQGVQLAPWQNNPEGHILICAARGFTEPRGIAGQPQEWPNEIARVLRAAQHRTVRIRHHPGNNDRDLAKATPLHEDMRGAYCVVHWASKTGFDALIRGIPVFYGARWWIGMRGGHHVDSIGCAPIRDDFWRLEAMECAAAAQWKATEIAAGVPFKIYQNMHPTVDA